ncbi:MAG: hypothetical protein ABIJ09_25075 [Pseudomonadota bacterium]
MTMIPRLCVVVTMASLAGAAWAAPEPMTRDAIINLAKSGVSYSYWWGHGRWRSDGAQHGSCSGSCPGCSHSGSYGADCSGFVAKTWQVPGPSPVTTDAHPYSTREFRYNTTHWTRVSRDSAKRADAFVYRNDANTGGHIVLYESGDAWGQIWSYEARGCSYGIVRNLRSLSSAYIGIRRNSLTEGVSTGTFKGCVFVDRGQGTADMSERIPGARIAIAGGASTTAAAGDAAWSLTASAGSHSLQASNSGYSSASRSCSVTAGAVTWCSIGLVPQCVPNCTSRSCGADPQCGTSCGTCSGDATCNAQGQCQAPTCEANCSGRSCGADPVCGVSCGTCGGNEVCGSDGQCAPPPCTPDCSGRSCGPDPTCGTSCGSCDDGTVCDDDGSCLSEVCTPDCSTRECGLDPACGSSCGTCAGSLFCSGEGQCVDVGPNCQPDCEGRGCGADPRCGVSCGECEDNATCGEQGSCQVLLENQGKLFGRVVVTEADADWRRASLAPGLPFASIRIDDQEPFSADASGGYERALTAGEHLVLASAPGHHEARVRCIVVAGDARECLLPLVRLEAPAPESGLRLINDGSCSALGTRAPLAVLAVLAALALPRRRSRRR